MLLRKNQTILLLKWDFNKIKYINNMINDFLTEKKTY